MALDADAAQMIAMMNAAGMPRTETMQPVEHRTMVEAAGKMMVVDKPAVARVTDLAIPAPHGAIAARLYADAAGPAPALLYFHGGGFVVGSIDSHDELARAIARDSGWAVLSIDYRLAPEHRYPAPLDDCYAALLWAAGAGGAANGIDGARLAVGGDSAGGNLAAAVALAARERGGPQLRHQLLIYPVIDTDFETASYRENGEGYFLTRDAMRWYWSHYLGEGIEPDQFAAPGRAPDKSGLAPATVITAEYDPLRDEGESYAEAIRAAGGEVALRRFPGVFHGFASMPMLARANEARAYIAERLRAAA